MSLCQGLVLADRVEKFNANKTLMLSDKTVLKYRTFRKLLTLVFSKPQNLHVTARCFGRDASTVALDNITRNIENPFHFNVTSREQTRTSLTKLTPV